MIDLKESLNEAMNLFNEAMEYALEQKQKVFEQCNKYEPGNCEERKRKHLEEVKTMVTEAKVTFASDIKNIENETTKDAEEFLKLSKLYFYMERNLQKDFEISFSDYNIHFLERCLHYIDLYKEAIHKIPDILFDCEWGGRTDCEIYIYLSWLHHKKGDDDKALSCLENCFPYIANKYGKNSANYAKLLCTATHNLPNECAVKFVEKWADATSTIKEYSSVWYVASMKINPNERQSLDEHLATIRKKIEYLERAASLDPDDNSTKNESQRWKDAYEKVIQKMGSNKN